MKFWKGRSKSVKERRNYTDAIVEHLIVNAKGGTTATSSECSALEIASSLYSRAFSSARTETDSPDWLDSDALGTIAGHVVNRGEVVCFVESGELFISSNYKIRGGYSKRSWEYDVVLSTPNNKDYKFTKITFDKIAHIRWSRSSKKRWMGLNGYGRAIYCGKLLANLEKSLCNEVSSPSGYLLPVPSADESVEETAKTLQQLKGGTALVETSAEGHGRGKEFAPMKDWEVKRIGANPPQTLVTLYDYALRASLASLGVPIELVISADGTGKREAWRQFLWGSVVPLSKRVEEELSKLSSERIILNFDELQASDISGRARAFQSLVGGGMDVDEALAVTGLVVNDDEL